MKKIVIAFLLLTAGITANAQDNSAAFQVDATNKGFLMPRVTTAQRTAIASPAAGLQVYDTTANEIYVFNGTAWTTLGGAGKFVDGTNPADAVYSDGKVGVGTDTPATNVFDASDEYPENILEIAGRNGKGATLSLSADGDYFPQVSYRRFNGVTKVNAAFISGINTNGDFTISYRGTDSNPYNAYPFVFTKDTRLGIGTVTPTALVEFRNYLTPSTTNPQSTAPFDGSADLMRLRGGNSTLGTLDYFIVKNDGKVGVGTATPTAKLQVVGLVEYANDAAAGAAGLTAGAFYHTAGTVKVKL